MHFWFWKKYIVDKNMEMEMILLLTNLILERPMSHFHKFEAMIVFDRFVFGWYSNFTVLFGKRLELNMDPFHDPTISHPLNRLQKSQRESKLRHFEGPNPFFSVCSLFWDHKFWKCN